MQKVIIIGSPGAGKSTLARSMGEKLSLPVVHLDKLFWKPGWVQISKEEFDTLLEQELHKERWIMDGNFSRTLPQRLSACDTVIYLDFSTAVCVLGVLKRVITTYGTTRPDMGDDCPERFDWDFLKFVFHFRRKNRHKIYQALEENQDKEIVILRNRKQVREFLRGL